MLRQFEITNVVGLIYYPIIWFKLQLRTSILNKAIISKLRTLHNWALQQHFSFFRFLSLWVIMKDNVNTNNVFHVMVWIYIIRPNVFTLHKKLSQPLMTNRFDFLYLNLKRPKLTFLKGNLDSVKLRGPQWSTERLSTLRLEGSEAPKGVRPG